MKAALILALSAGIALWLYGCNKSSEPEPDIVVYEFQGQTYARYVDNALDYQTGEFTHTEWDSTYADKITVTINHASRKIRFSWTPNTYPAQTLHSEYEFDYTPEKASYIAEGSTLKLNHYLTFTGKDSLYSTFHYNNGYGPNNVSKSVYFAGKR